jgi:hypothetical protein
MTDEMMNLRTLDEKTPRRGPVARDDRLCGPTPDGT